MPLPPPLPESRPLFAQLFSRKMAALLLLGFASGLPLFLVGKTLQAWLTGTGASLATLGWLNLIGLPYTLKFVWAPLVDRFQVPLLGRRRGWLALLQALLAPALAALSLQDPGRNLPAIAVIAVAVAFLSATQDICFDAYRTELLDPQELGNGSALGVFGYRSALLVTGSLALFLADWWTWPRVYLLMAALMVIAVPVTLWAPEPSASQPPASLVEAIRLPMADFFERNGVPGALTLLGFIVLYKLCDGLAAGITTPFLLRLGFSNSDLGSFGGIGFGTLTAGVVVGGLLLSRLGVGRCLWLFGIAQAVSNLGYLLLAWFGYSFALGVLVSAFESFCTGLVAAAFVAFLTGQCNPRFAATQYALLSSLMAFGGTVVSSAAGVLATAVGWPVFYGLTILAALPGLALLPLVIPRETV